MSDIKIQTTNDIKSDENAEPQMTAETYRFVMSWNYYPEPITGEPQVNLGVHARMPDFSVLNFKDGIRCFPAGQTVFEQREPNPGAGFCEGNHTVRGLSLKPEGYCQKKDGRPEQARLHREGSPTGCAKKNEHP